MTKEIDAHRDIVDREVQRLSYPSERVFSQAFNDFMDAHQWSLKSAAFACILLKSGPSMEIAHTNPGLELLVFRFRCKAAHDTPSSQRRDPSNTFELIEHGFLGFLEYTLRGVLSVQGYTDMMNESRIYHEQLLERNDETYVGSMPILYVINNVTFRTTVVSPVRRPPQNLPVTSPMRTALEAFIRLCANSVNGGLPLRVNDPGRPFHPVPGRVVRSSDNLRWTWEPLFSDWDEFHDGRAGCGPQVVSRLLAGLNLPASHSPASLMHAFGCFWLKDSD
ncbi:hypothetical protein TRAPUB_1070 [Trametes pubescens]|uniref:Uncharacterized protein n=1 Tax=Trametes pubescens TaxID=154538 RepID=A0A1M2VKA2_TRAPU|nr:hypothetical protein TRAPUB_1070 [Trametes pubescens]